MALLPRNRSLIPAHFLTMLTLMLKAGHSVRALNKQLHAYIATQLPKRDPHQ